jgi:putative ABC transport system permease protein
VITRRTLPLRNVLFFARNTLPVLLGVTLATAVLTGSLVVGDSLRGSLRERALRRLNGVESSTVGPRFLDEKLAKKLGDGVAPVLLLNGSVTTVSSDGALLQATRVQVIGLPAGTSLGIAPPAGKAVASARLAAALKLTPGSTIEIGVEKMSNVPRSSLLGDKNLDTVTTKIAIEIGEVLPPDASANDFDLSPNPRAPVNLFVPLALLQERVAKPGKVNALLAFGGTAAELNAKLDALLTPADWGIRLRPVEKPGYVSVESEQLILAPSEARAVKEAAESLGVRAEPTLSYLANAIALGDKPVLGTDAAAGVKYLPYSVIAALNPAAKPPLGPFLPPGVTGLADDEIVLADWPASPLRGLAPGTTLTVTYFKPEMEASAEEATARFRLKGYVPLAGVAADPALTPPFPGITDKLKIGDWDAPFPIAAGRVKPRDEDYWNQYKTTPKAYINAAAGDKLFGSRFGSVTSYRVAPPDGTAPAAFEPALRDAIRTTLDPAASGLRFDDTRERLLASSQSGTDFGVIFLLFSGLLIGVAVERRAKEVGLLLAVGYSPAQVRGVIVTEGLIVAVAGTLLGLLVSLPYAGQMLNVLVRLWPDGEIGSYLQLHVSPWTPALGFGLTMLTAYLTIRLALRGLTRVAPPRLLHGVTATSDSTLTPTRSSRLAWVVVTVVVLVAVGSLAFGPTRVNPDERAGAFFTGGILLLAAGLLALRLILRSAARFGAAGRWSLGVRNAAPNSSRTLLTAALVAGAVFLVVSVESFRRKPGEAFAEKSGGSGGLPLIAETDVPVFQRFDRGPGKLDLLDSLAVAFQKQEAHRPGGPSRAVLGDRAENDLASLVAYPFRLRGGDDASCLNLAQPGRPRVLGVPDSIIDRGGFRFTETLAETDAERANPWLILRRVMEPLPDGRVPVPVFAEQNTVYFALKTMLGGVVEIPDETGRLVPVKVAGMLQDSVFQSDLLMADGPFRTLFPHQEGYRVFLLDVPADKHVEVSSLLETGLRSYGMRVEKSADRVALYQAVVGAYLSTFQLLGAFGLILAVLGLSVVILRNVAERAGELALLRAVGFRFGDLAVTVVAETLFVLAAGLLIGVGAALASVLPNLALGGSIPWERLGILLAVTSAVGVLVAVGVTLPVARMPIIPALRKD